MSFNLETQIFPSIDAANEVLKCSRPHGGSGGAHWWYTDRDAMEEMLEGGERGDGPGLEDYVPCLCKTCGTKMRLSVDAEEYPGI